MSTTENATEKDARDVLADRIETWADTEDWHVYDYADRLINDLDAAGYEIVRRKSDPPDAPSTDGATLLLSLFVPTWGENDDPDDSADAIAAALNRTWKLDHRIVVGLFPAPQWFTADTMAVLRRAAELVRGEGT